MGTFAANGPVDQGSEYRLFDGAQGLVSGVGGELLHPLEFHGAEITPTQSGSGIVLEEPNEADPSLGMTTWSSHPSQTGFLRPSSSGSGFGGTLGGSTGGGSNVIAPSQDSGTGDGSMEAEAQRLEIFNGGSAENPTSTQDAPTARAQQQTGGGGVGPMQTAFNPPAGGGGVGPMQTAFNPRGGGGAGTTLGAMIGIGVLSAVNVGPKVYDSASNPDTGMANPSKLGPPVVPSSLWDNAINALDSVAAGIANQVTGGLTNRARDGMYGEIATRNQQGTLYNAGQGFGMFINLGLGFANPCAQASNIGTGLRVLNGIQAVGNGWNAYDNYQDSNYLGMALNGLGILGNVSQFMKSCFAAGTPLLTPDDSRPIEDFRVGDLVLSRHEDDPEGPLVARRVLNVFHNYSPLTEIHVGGQVIRTTAEHPFWVVGRGWTDAHQIVPGDALLGADGEQTVVAAIVGPKEPAPVYNLEIEEYHTYYVGSALWRFFVWAHNSSVYQAFNSKTGKGYVGVAETELGTNPVLQRLNSAGQKVGSPAGKIDGLEELADDLDAYAVEQALINYYGLAKNGGRLLNKNLGHLVSPEMTAFGYRILKAIGYVYM
ncbi:MAG: polymorphic toxin-type HINT domain-containing protein [Isosphaeraceae bacterium]